MIQARVSWVTAPYKAGFCITDDTDAATLEQVRAVYDFLKRKNFRTTKTVWAFNPQDHCGIPPTPDSTLRGITLEDPGYRAYCRSLHEAGFEIGLHGASAGNNRREFTQQAFELLEREIGASDTFICHSKNADNLYWEAKVTRRQPFRWLLGKMSRHESSGEIPSSPFFWGDLCSARINQIRLLRTRRVDTLARNPSMPYFDPEKPLVNGWFSATKLPLSECASDEARAALKRNRGLTVLYQYLHRYAKPAGLDPVFCAAIEALAGDPEIHVDTVSRHMRRLRQVQGIFTAVSGNDFWVVNTGPEDIADLRILLSGPLPVPAKGDLACIADSEGWVLPRVPARSVSRFTSSGAIRFQGSRTRRAKAGEAVRFPLPLGQLFVNLGDTGDLASPLGKIPPRAFLLSAPLSGTGFPQLSTISRWEEMRLLTDQTLIILREILFKGRRLDPEKYLDPSSGMPLEDHSQW